MTQEAFLGLAEIRWEDFFLYIIATTLVQNCSMFTQFEQENPLSWPNVGRATAQDLNLIGVHRLDDLQGRSADELYAALNSAKGVRCDPCCWDVFASLVHFSETSERRKWWEFTPVRKSRKDPV